MPEGELHDCNPLSSTATPHILTLSFSHFPEGNAVERSLYLSTHVPHIPSEAPLMKRVTRSCVPVGTCARDPEPSYYLLFSLLKLILSSKPIAEALERKEKKKNFDLLSWC